jgi:sugar O-acyltransferase (sialic acid O-acetyltransferase NeuD family)
MADAAIQGSSPTALLIFPFNGNAVEAVDCLGKMFRLVGFIDDTPAKRAIGSALAPVLGREALEQYPEALVLAVPGSPTSYPARRQVIDALGLPPARFATVVHSGAHVSPTARLGHNVLVMAGVVVTSNAVVGNHVCLLPNSVIHHDVDIGDYTLVGSNVTIAGGVKIGENCYISSASSFKNGLRIGARTLVGLGSTVTGDLPVDSRVAGNPARALGQR